MVQQALSLMDHGNYEEASKLFTIIASEAARRNGPKAPFFYFQAGRGYILARQIERGIAAIKDGLSLLAERKQFLQLHKSSLRAINGLIENGFAEEASVMEQWVSQLVPKESRSGMESFLTKEPRGLLPTKCESCGGRVHPEEVDWIDDRQATCAYCGNILQVKE